MERKLIFKRDIEAEMLKWVERREAYAIKGPRQSGKITMLRHLGGILKEKGANTVFLNFEDPDVLEAFERNLKEYVRNFILSSGLNSIIINSLNRYLGS